jgi:hypothetical protein
LEFNLTEKKNEKLGLYWICNQTGRKQPAGVAFFNETQGDYRLKIDVMPEDKTVYLKATSMNDGVVQYRVETVVRKQGRAAHRTQIGTGHSKANDGYPIYMDIGPFSRGLVLDQES